jgi:hypothetical protein
MSRMIPIATVAATVLLSLLAGEAAARDRVAVPRIKVISGRADLVSAGDALVAVKPPKRTRPKRLRLRVNGSNVTKEFAVRENGRFEALLSDLRLGRNKLVAKVRRRPGSAARLALVNHPNGGPVFSGPQLQPWVCQDTAVDDQCNQPASYSYEYMATGGAVFQPYDPQNPPSDVATTTTDEGKTVPYIVRTETGYQDRDQYKIAILFDPAKPFAPWAPQDGWNHKLLITHGASCGIDHKSGDAPSVTGDTVGVPGAGGGTSSPTVALSRGFAVMSTALDNAGHNCNLVTQAESLVMAKERVVEQYGPIRYTIGTGCSGGSLTQQQVANAYPGIYQGILPQCSFPDSWSTGQQLVDYHLVRLYLENPARWAPGVVWTPLQIAAVEGHPNHVNSIILDSLYWTALGDPTNPCAGVTDAERYNPDSNPAGARCTLADDMINALGPREPAVWGPQEQAIGHGFAGLPLDNVGVEYGLEALHSGAITPSQFVDLNAKVGGGTIDSVPTEARFEADQPALRNAYRSGGVNSTNNLDRVAIIDLRGPDPGAFHDAYRSWAIRARLEREHGTYANQVIWFGQAPLIGDPRYTTQGLIAIDRWLAEVEKDRRKVALAQKIIDDRPADINDRCSAIDGVEMATVPGVGQVCTLDAAQTKYGTPRTVAGESIATDTNKCRLRPLARDDYAPVSFTDAEWAQLELAFPTGVCDYSRKGVAQRGAIPWLTYQDAKGRVIYGGKPLGKPPRSKRIRHRSR